MPLPLSKNDDLAFGTVFANQINLEKFWLDLTRTSDSIFLNSEKKKISYSNLKESDYHFGFPDRLYPAVGYTAVADCCYNLDNFTEYWAFCERLKVSLSFQFKAMCLIN